MCPLCNYPHRCPCDACKDKGKKSGITPWIRFKDIPELEDCEECPCCGTVLHLDQWESIAWENSKLHYKMSNQSGGCLAGIYEEKVK